MAASQYHRPGTLWYVSDGYVWDDLPADYRREPGRPLECSSKLFVFNPQPQSASVLARFYHTDRPPTSFSFSVAAGTIESVELASLSEIPHRQAFWIALESDIPVLPQARHEDFTFWDPVPDAIVSVAPYPGPLEDETSWVFPDCYQSGGKPWYEREMLNLLNPNPHPVKARVRYLLRGQPLGGEEVVEIPGERTFCIESWDRSVPLLGSPKGPSVKIQHDHAVRIDASGPIVAQTTRRCRWAGRPSIVGSRSTMGFPLRGAPPALWHYPGGDIVDRGLLPRDKNCDVTWNLLFTHNLSETDATHATVTFHNADGSETRSEPLSVPPLKSDLEWLHLPPWLGRHTAVNAPFALTITAESPVVPGICGAEFEMWSQVCPGAMTAVNACPGPLRDERLWWLGIGHAGGADDRNTEWQQTYHLFNPGRAPARVTLSFLGLDAGETVTYSVTIAPGAVAKAASSDIAGLPPDRPFAVRAESDQPICAQVYGRTFTRGLAHTRAMYSFLGIPMPLT
jgi:hypothetical protein